MTSCPGLTMKLSILMLALTSRPWQKLADDLKRQCARHKPGEASLSVLEDAGESSSGTKRQRLVESTTGEYLCFVDDDDAVASDYVANLLHGCNKNPSVVSFNLDLKHKNKHEIWKFGMYVNDRRRGKMTVNHLCAWRRDLASRVAWCPSLGYADDQVWLQPLAHANFPIHEHHIERVLYHYQFSEAGTANQTSPRKQAAKDYVGKGLRCFFYGPEIMIEVGGIPRHETSVVVRDRHNVERRIPLDELRWFHTIRIE